jgi:hypothetical protein
MVWEAKANTGLFVREDVVPWLPAATNNFFGL